MRGWIYPRAVLLILVNIILKASCKGSGSLTFLIDDTSSMGDDIKQVRRSVHRIKDIVLHEKSSLIDNMVLVTLNDPGVHKRIVTTDPNKFKTALDAIKPENEAKRPYLDCWEPAMRGLLLALENSNNNSYIFVFTDAPAKDYNDSQSVIEMCQKKQTQIVFVLTGTLCGKFPYPADAIGVYSDIAVACSGLAIIVKKNEVNKVFGPIEEIIKGNKTVITTATIPAGIPKNIQFTIDDHTDYVIVYAYGKNVSLKINERSISTKDILSTDNAKAIKLSNAKPGRYHAEVKGATRTSVLIVGRTDFFFSHGFSEKKPKSLSDTSQTVSAGERVYLSISVTDDHQSMKIISAQLSDMDGKPILTKLPLSKISKDFYITDSFIAPSQRFKVAVNGIVIATNQPIKRTSKIPATPSPPKIAPEVQGEPVITINKNETVQLECKVVKGFPAPKITWLYGDKSGSKFTPINSDSVLVLKNVEYKDDGKYKCVAENEKGKDEHVTTLNILDKPKIVSSTSTKYKSTEGDALLKIPCNATGLPKPNITWKLKGGVIHSSAKYSIEDGTLIIRDPKVNDTNSYTCEAKNSVDTVSATFNVDISQKPQVSGVAAKQVRVGSSASIECMVVKGKPKPTITWQFLDNSGSTFSQIAGSDKVLHISRVENKHAGRYKCTAQNAVGIDEHITTLQVQDLPKIISRVSTTYQSTEGDAVLRIPCVATGLPKPSITWKLNGRVINPSVKYYIDDGTLIIRHPKVSDTKSYTCEAKNEVGAVSATFSTYIRQKPQVSGVAVKKVRVGSSASVECTVNKGVPKPKITWQFSDNSSTIFVSILGSDKVLLISRVENNHAGRYKCVAQNSVGSAEHITTIVVQDLPKIISRISTIYQSIEGDALLRVPCAAAGLPMPSITWKMDGHVINPSVKYSIEGGTLVIRNPNVSDTNSYTCEAKNEVGAVSATFSTYIRQKPQVSGVAVKKVRVGSSASVECTVNKGVPKPKITWQFSDNSSTIFVPIPGSDKVLLISRVENNHAGRYKCVAQNSVGSAEHITTIVVQDLPKIISRVSTTYQSIEGDALLRIPCATARLPMPSITWKMDGHVINPSMKYSIEGGTLVIRNPKVSDTNSYTCEAKNEVGAVSATFSTYIRQKPQVSGVAVKKVRVGSSASVECTVSKGEPKPTIIWQFLDNSGSNFLPMLGSDKVLHISKVENKHAGCYKCVAQNSVGSAEHITTIVVQDLPKILSSVSTTYQSTEGAALLSVPCAVAGLPKPSITWKIDGRVINPSEKYSIKDGTLIIRDPKVSDTKSYTCEAKNEVGAVSATFRTYIRQAPQVSGDSAKQVLIGNAASIECKITKGEPKPTITWQFMDNGSSKFLSTAGSERVLYISRVEHKHAGRYKCVAENSVGRDSHITTLEVQEAPQVSGVAAKKMRLGSPISIECMIKGTPKPTVTWKFMDKFSSKFLQLPGSDEVLHISRVENKHAGSYKCVAQNDVGSDEHITILEVHDVPKIVSSGTTTYESTERDALLRIPCVVTGLPKPSITWKLYGRVINPGPKYSIENGTLIIKDPKVSDTNSYTCEAKNEVGAVNATFRTYIRQAPQLTGVVAKKAIIGSVASIKCTFKGEPKPTLTWQFMDNSSSKFSTIPGSEKVLTISKVENKHAGRYKCVAQNDVGYAEHITTLEVQDLPEIVSNVSTIYQGTEGDALLRIPCTATGQPKPSITWKLDGHVINPSWKFSIEDGTLIIRGPKVSDTNSYTCEARNEVGAVSATFKIYIHQAPMLSGVPAEKVKIGSSASIKCSVKGEPEPTITWQFMGISSAKFLPIPGSDKMLHISKVENGHAGRYKCLAHNSVGSAQHVTILEVQDLPKIVSSVSTIYQSTEGDALLRIPCTATGQPKPSITWKLDGHVMNPSTKYSIEDGMLVIRDPKVSDTNSYTCEAKNEVGAASATFRTYIRQLPKLSGVASKNVRMGNPVDIECHIDQGEPTPTISWQFSDKAASEFVPIGGSENTLHITNAENKHAGRYKCVAQNKVGTDEHVTTLIVEYLPGITIKSTTVDGIVGDLALRIPCNVIGVPQPAITWKINGTAITPNGKYSIVDGALVIAKPAKKDSSSYTCEAKNSIGSVSATFQAAVTNHPKSFGTVHYVYVKQGETKNLECEAYNNSESQSVKWFITQEGLHYLDSSLSTTSSPTELDSLETTTSSTDKDSSTTPRITMLDTGKKEQYYQIVNASSFKHDGNYTCRVSDKHGNTQTHTYVVDVGIAPKFISDGNSISGWRGDVEHITQFCDTKEAKPQPEVQWRFNGKELTDVNWAGVGHYTCNVSNVHGSVMKQFDVKSSACFITRNLRDAQNTPLVLNDEGSWHKLETTDYYMIVEQESKIYLSCPSQKETLNTFQNFPKKSSLEAICKENSFIVDDKTYTLSDLQCTNSIQPSVIRTKVKCSTETSELIRVGYNVPGFLEAYEVCFDYKINMPSYTRIIMTDTNNNGLNAGYNWYTYPGIGYEQTERGFTCKDATSSCCYSKSQLVNAIDFNDGPAKKSTFIDPLNVIPVWLPCDNDDNNSKSPWEDINDKVRDQLYTDIVVWSGTHTLQEKNGAVIPRYLWKVVKNDDDVVIAIVYVNDPKPTDSDIKCKTSEICDTYEAWIVGNYSIYCCSLPDFIKSFHFHDTYFGETLDEALDSMKKIPIY